MYLNLEKKKEKILAGPGLRMETHRPSGAAKTSEAQPSPFSLFEGCLQAFSCLLAKDTRAIINPIKTRWVLQHFH